MRAIGRHEFMYSLSFSCQDDSRNQNYVMFLALLLNFILFHVYYVMNFTKLQLLLVNFIPPNLELAAKVFVVLELVKFF